MLFAELTGYIEGLYQQYPMMKQADFIEQTTLKEFTPVIETETARLLMLLLRLKAPRRVLELGTSIGYSTMSMAQVVQEWRGRIVTVEFDETVAAQARQNFEMTGMAETIELVIGDARELLPAMDEKFDFIFLDLYNDLYPDLCADCVRLLNQGGLLIADDTLMPVLECDPPDYQDPLHHYNKIIAQNQDLDSTILPVGDGVTLAVKK